MAQYISTSKSKPRTLFLTNRGCRRSIFEKFGQQLFFIEACFAASAEVFKIINFFAVCLLYFSFQKANGDHFMKQLAQKWIASINDSALDLNVFFERLDHWTRSGLAWRACRKRFQYWRQIGFGAAFQVYQCYMDATLRSIFLIRKKPRYEPCEYDETSPRNAV